MTIKRTTNHEEIRGWIEENKGSPAVVIGTTNRSGPGALHIIFDEEGDNFRAVTWPEFFDIFERRGLRFHYDTNKRKKREFAYGFERRDIDPDSSESDETELPEDRGEAEENMFPSAP